MVFCLLLSLGAGIAAGHADPADRHFEMGSRYMARGEYSRAIEEFNKVLATRPDSLETHTDIALSYSALGRYRDAVNSYQRAVRINPDDAVALGGMGAAYFQLKEYQPAAECYEKAIRVDPGNAYYHDGLGLVYTRLGRSEAGRRSLGRAVELYLEQGNLERAAVLEKILAGLDSALESVAGWEFLGNRYNGHDFPGLGVYRRVEFDDRCEQVKVSQKTMCREDSCPIMDSMRALCMFWTCDGPYQGNKEKDVPVRYELNSYLVDCRNKKILSLGTEWYGFGQALIGRSRWPEQEWSAWPTADEEQMDEIRRACGECPGN